MKRLIATGVLCAAFSASAADTTQSAGLNGTPTTPFNAVSATATATSAADAVNPFQNYALAISYSAGITGTPQGCQIQPQTSVDGVNYFNYGNPIPILPTVSGSGWLPPNGHPGPFGLDFKYVYSCNTYPSAGTFTVKAYYSGRDSTQATTNDSVLTGTCSGVATIGPLALNGAQGVSISITLAGAPTTFVATAQLVENAPGNTQTNTATLITAAGAVGTIGTATNQWYQVANLAGAQAVQVQCSFFSGGSSPSATITIRATAAQTVYPVTIGVRNVAGNDLELRPFAAGTSATSQQTNVGDAVNGYSSGVVLITWGTITGSPATCTLQPQTFVNGSGSKNFGPAIGLSPATATQERHILPSYEGPFGSNINYKYNCGTFPTGGTFTMDASYSLIPHHVSTVLIDGEKATYHAGKVSRTLASGATDFCYVTGSATKTVKITEITFSGSATTAVAVPIVVVKRSTANTAGTCSTAAGDIVPLDSKDPVATATYTTCTANPTTGTLIGNVEAQTYFLGATTALPSATLKFDFGVLPGERALVLRGTSEVAALNANGTTITGGLFDCKIAWTEEDL